MGRHQSPYWNERELDVTKPIRRIDRLHRQYCMERCNQISTFHRSRRITCEMPLEFSIYFDFL